MRPDIAEKLKGFPDPARWIVVDGQTGECLSDPPEHYRPGFNAATAPGMVEWRKSKELPAKQLYIPDSGGLDSWMYVVGDVGEDVEITGRHANVFVEGKLGKGAEIRVAKGMVSVASLGENSHLGCRCPALVDSIADSRQSKNLSQPNYSIGHGGPIMLEIKPGKRREVYAKSCGGSVAFDISHEFSSDQLARGLRTLKNGKLITSVYVPPAHDLSPSVRDAGLDSLAARR